MRTIILKEFIEYLKSIQFFFLLFFSLALFLIGGIVLGSRYRQAIDNPEVQSASTVSTNLVENPSPFGFMSMGYQDSGLHTYRLSPGGNISAGLRESGNFMLPSLPPPDWAFIVKCVFGLYVMLFGFRMISGEKELGTLRLIMSNRLGRLPLAAAKYLSVMLAVGVALLAGFLAGAVMTGIIAPEIFNVEFLIRATIFFIASLAWISLFAFLALTVSSLIPNSSMSLLTLLSAWILFVLVIPNAAGPISEKLTPASGEYEISRNLGPAFRQKMKDTFKPIQAKLVSQGLDNEERFNKEFSALCLVLYDDYTKTLDTYHQSLNRRETLRRALARVSPASLFQFSTEELAGTGFKTEEDFLRHIREYSSQYDNYIQDKTGELIRGTDFQMAYAIKLENGKTVLMESPVQKEYEGDKSDFPYFSNSESSLKTCLANALPDLAGLLAWNILIALTAFTAVRKCDVR